MPGIEREKRAYKKTRGTPFCSGAQQHWTDCPNPNTELKDDGKEEVALLPEMKNRGVTNHTMNKT